MSHSSQPTKRKKPVWLRVALLATLVGVAALSYAQWGDQLNLESLAAQEDALREYQSAYPILVYLLAFVVYVSVTGLSIPGATGLTLLYAWYFGFRKAVLLVSFASTAGATIAFLISRYLLRDPIQQRWGDRLKRFNEALEREGAFYLFTLRLIPAIPFFVINVVMGLTPIRTTTYWWVSQLGMLPATCVYVFTGSSIPSLNALADRSEPIISLKLLIAFAALGLFPLVAKKVMQRFRPRETTTTLK